MTGVIGIDQKATSTDGGKKHTDDPPGEVGTSVLARGLTALSPKRIGAVYVWILAIAIFSLLKPHVFPTFQTFQGITSQYAVTGMAAIAIVVSLASGAFDLTIGANIGLSALVFALMVQQEHASIVEAIIVTLAVGLAIALANIMIVVVFDIDSFIGTLAMSAILDALGSALCGNQFVTIQRSGDWTKFATGQLWGIQLPFYYLLVIAVAIGYWLERTQSGRYIYATGFNRETARLTGLNVPRLRAAGYLTSGLVGAFAGLILATQVGSATPQGGDAYLIPAFSAAFLGATQIRPGRFNTWGTLVAVFLLATGDYGITIVGGPAWATQMFEGVVLLVAIGLAQFGGNRLVSRDNGKKVLATLRARFSQLKPSDG